MCAAYRSICNAESGAFCSFPFAFVSVHLYIYLSDSIFDVKYSKYFNVTDTPINSTDPSFY